ncbi:MAG: PDZ domain-containing protein [Planctomycetia bacterium]|nr:PDZ domain-containing protein [Planctomycetia bacterium]
MKPIMKVLLCLGTALLIMSPAAGQQRDKVAKSDAVAVVDGAVREIFRSPRQNRVDILVQIDVSRCEARKRINGNQRVSIPAPGESVYVHIYQLNTSINPVAALDSYAAVPAERSQVRAYLIPRETGGWEGVFPDWFEVTAERLNESSPSDPSPEIPDSPKTPVNVLGMTSEVIRVSNRTALKVTSVERGGPAQKAGLEIGDVIVAANSLPITSAEQLTTLAKEKSAFPLHVVDVNTGRVAQIELRIEQAAAGNLPPAADDKPNTTPPSAAGRSLGVMAEPVTIGSRTAMKVTRVEPDSPAAKAGLEVNDVIVDANGQPVTGVEQLTAAVRKSGSTLMLTVRDTRTGRNTPVKVEMGGNMPEINLPGGGLPANDAKQQANKLGVVTELAFFNVEAAVKITEVEPGSSAQRAGLRVGMLILEANGTPILHPNTLNEVVRKSGATLKLKVVSSDQGSPSSINVNLQ